MNQPPEWLKFSGLPEKLNAKIRVGAWSVFWELVGLDCARNRHPGLVELTVSELAERVGLKTSAVERILKGLSKAKASKCFVPQHPDEELLFEVCVPLKAPRVRAEIERLLRRAGTPGPWDFRYRKKVALDERDEAALQEAVDAYFNTISMKMNAFILDELRLLSARFTLDRIKRVFEFARQQDIRSLGWAARELYRREKRDRKDDEKSESAAEADAAEIPWPGEDDD